VDTSPFFNGFFQDIAQNIADRQKILPNSFSTTKNT